IGGLEIIRVFLFNSIRVLTSIRGLIKLGSTEIIRVFRSLIQLGTFSRDLNIVGFLRKFVSEDYTFTLIYFLHYSAVS
ncbi:hypothetical protein Leryth_024997, partial [Lithospermum erythrorhizon]